MSAGGKRSPESWRRLQGLAFALILLASAGLYYTATHDMLAGTWMLLGLVAVGMLLALWIS